MNNTTNPDCNNYIPCEFCLNKIPIINYERHVNRCSYESYLTQMRDELYNIYSELEDVNVGFEQKYIDSKFPEKIIDKNKQSINDCVICLGKIECKYRELSCNHIYCSGCINTWLLSHKKCPLCYKNL